MVLRPWAATDPAPGYTPGAVVREVIRLKPEAESEGSPTCRVRHRGSELVFSEGDFLLGRSPSCHVVLDDPLASRRHARLTVTAGKVTIEDLDSINGTFVNGVRLADVPCRLDDHDRVIIGGDELEILIGSATPAVDEPEDVTMETLTPGKPLTSTVDPVVREKKPRRVASTTGRVDALELLGTIADKALAMGHFQDADRVLGTHLRNVLEDARASRGVLPENREIVAKYALRFAEASGDGAWFDLVIELHHIGKAVCQDEIIIELQVALDKVDEVDLDLLLRYIEGLQALDLGKKDIHRAQRIEELAVVARNKCR